ncbi:septal ring lytic transglycosylase RlpA family protein [Myxacorys almedinensis]|nr:septal ring lytic transglycosylase RlpA family protein [Myxacorys almedinensis]
MLILGLVWVASWFGGISSLGGKLLEAPRYLSIALSSHSSHSATVAPQDVPSSKSSFSIQTVLGSVSNSVRFGFAAAERPSRQATNSSFAEPESWLETVEDLLLNAAFEPEVRAVSPPRPTPSAASTSPKSMEAAQSQPSDRSMEAWLEMAESFLLGLPSLATEPDGERSSVLVVEVGNDGTALSPHSKWVETQGLLKCATSYNHPSSSPSEHSAMGGFQIWVQDCWVASLPDRQTADAIAAALIPLANETGVNPADLQPALIEGRAVGKFGDRTLFTISAELAARLGRPAELIAIEWINNLRISLGHPPVPLATAQVQMHQLDATDTSIDGKASWYGFYFHGRQTATGEIFDQNALTAAHRSLPFGTYLKVTNLLNGKSVVVRINDRGPYFDEGERVIDLSNRAARCISSHDRGVVPIEAVVLQPSSPAKVASQVTTQVSSLPKTHITGY